MNTFTFGELYIGQCESFQKEITAEMADQFKALTGDENPIHTDKEYALKQGFLDRVVYGMLTASLVSVLGGMYLPGRHCLIQAVEMKFLHPVYIGDILSVSGTVTDLHESVSQAVIRVAITNGCNVRVCKGILRAGVLSE